MTLRQFSVSHSVLGAAGAAPFTADRRRISPSGSRGRSAVGRGGHALEDVAEFRRRDYEQGERWRTDAQPLGVEQGQRDRPGRGQVGPGPCTSTPTRPAATTSAGTTTSHEADLHDWLAAAISRCLISVASRTPGRPPVPSPCVQGTPWPPGLSQGSEPVSGYPGHAPDALDH